MNYSGMIIQVRHSVTLSRYACYFRDKALCGFNDTVLLTLLNCYQSWTDDYKIKV